MSEGTIKVHKEVASNRPARMAWILVGAYVVLATAGLILLSRPGMPPNPFYSGWQPVLQAVGIGVMSVMGALIVSRHPGHPIGWLFVVVSLILGLDLFAYGYAAYGLAVNPLPGALQMAPVADEVAFMAVYGLILGLLLFPDGRFLSSGWRNAAWAVGLAAVAADAIWLTSPGPLNELPFVENPFAIDRGLYARLQPFAALVSNVVLPLLLLAAVISLYLRFRRGNQVKRQQIKWFVFGTAPFAVGAAIQLVFSLSTSFGHNAFVTMGLVTLPVATAIAIFKYRLYEIDLIINRTLVYGGLTVGVALFYGATVSATGYLLQADNNLAALLVTLVMAVGLFRPLRATIQRRVDAVVGGVQKLPSSAAAPEPAVAESEIQPAQQQTEERPRLAGISPDTATIDWLAWGLAGVAILISVAGFVLSIVGTMTSGDTFALLYALLYHIALNPFVTIAYAILGALVASRRPGNVIGWVFLAVAVLYAVTIGAGAYGNYAAIVPGVRPLPGVAFAEWLAHWFWVPSIVLPTVFVFLLFPDGRLLSSRWRPVLWSASLGMGMATVGLAIEGLGTTPNFSGVPFAAQALESFLTIGGWLVGIGLVGAIASFVLRFRRSRDVERQQLKWLLYAVLLAVAVLVIASLASIFSPNGARVRELTISAISLTILGIALAASVAILRYRLYDIDVIINRTLVYGALTLSVALFYAITVSVTGYFLQTESGAAGLLLTVAVVFIFFRPLRATIQKGADAVVDVAPDSGPSSPAAAPVTNGGAIQGSSEQARGRSYGEHLPLIALVVLLVGVPLAFTWVHVRTPFANDRLPHGTDAMTAEGVIVAPLEAGPPGLRAGDVVTEVDGRSLEAWMRSPDGGRQVGDTVAFSVIRDEERVEINVTPEQYPLGAILRREWGTVLFRTLTLLIGVYVFLRRPYVSAARLLFLSSAALFSAMTWSLGLQVTDFVNGIGTWLFHLGTIVGFMLVWIANEHFALTFPQPAGILRTRKWLLRLMYGLPYALLAVYLLFTRAQAANVLAWMGRWEWFTGPHAAAFLTLSSATIVWQYRRSHGATRKQIRWLVLAGLVVGASAVLLYFVPLATGSRALDSNLIGLVGVLFPLALAISILRYNLFDIDKLLNRALVYGALTTVIIAVYVLVVGVLGTFLQTQGNLLVALIATGLAAVMFQPLRERLQKTVNRFMYGERDEPFDVLARLGQRLESTLSPEMVYPTIVETVSQALKLPYTGIAVWRKGRLETAESYGKPVADPVTYPLTYQGEIVGQLLVGRRAPDEAFSAADERILRNIARQAGAAVHAAQLTADLQRSRQRLVTAREEERRRLRRDLHDGLGPTLAAQMFRLGSARSLLESDPEAVDEILAQLEGQTEQTLAEIRRLVYNLRPPALDQLGLAAAVREYAAQYNGPDLAVTVETPDSLPPLPAAVEVAAYRIVQEALTNVVHHAEASQCHVTVICNDNLRVSVGDDGRGLPDDYRSGVGLTSMRERAAELGGVLRVQAAAARGTEVTAILPLVEASG